MGVCGSRAAVYVEPTYPSPTHQMRLWRRRAESMLAAAPYRGKNKPFFLILLLGGGLCIWARECAKRTSFVLVLLVVDSRHIKLSKTGLVVSGARRICTK